MTGAKLPKNTSFTVDKESYFPTLIYKADFPHSVPLNKQLLDLIYTERERDQEGVERSNLASLGSWHSHAGLHKEAAYEPLTRMIELAAQNIAEDLAYSRDKELKIGSMWSIINPPGSYNKSHVHPKCHWSGVYYIQAPKGCGDIEFTDPRTAYLMDIPKFEPGVGPKENWVHVGYTPFSGLMLIFPSWLYHSVEPNISNFDGKMGDRVVVSFNLSQTLS